MKFLVVVTPPSIYQMVMISLIPLQFHTFILLQIMLTTHSYLHRFVLRWFLRGFSAKYPSPVSKTCYYRSNIMSGLEPMDIRNRMVWIYYGWFWISLIQPPRMIFQTWRMRLNKWPSRKTAIIQLWWLKNTVVKYYRSIHNYCLHHMFQALMTSTYVVFRDFVHRDKGRF